jgi:hypothetical protein
MCRAYVAHELRRRSRLANARVPIPLQDFVDRYEGRYQHYQLPLPIRLAQSYSITSSARATDELAVISASADLRAPSTRRAECGLALDCSPHHGVLIAASLALQRYLLTPIDSRFRSSPIARANYHPQDELTRNTRSR